MTTQPVDRFEHEQSLDDVLTGYFKAIEAGETPDRERLYLQHPELADDLREFFTGEDRLDQFAAPLRPVLLAARQEKFDTRLPDLTPHANDDSLNHDRPALIGEYDVIEEIAHGGMGIVYLARHRQLHRTVAVKVLLAGPFARPVDRQRFRSETEMVASLDHPNIVPIYDVGEHERQPYFSMKFVEGGSLAAHAERFLADPTAAATLLLTLARAVHHAHERGILHRDLKPSNVLLDRDGQPYLTDFGLARWVAEDKGLSQSGAIIGTPSFMAPEQALGQRQMVTTASDVYSLGAILFYLLTGKPPFRGDSALDTLRQVHEREPESPGFLNPRVPRDLETICLHGLAKDPRKRYATAQDLADDLASFLEGSPIRARVASRRERIGKWVRRKPAQAALLAVSGLAFIGLVAGGVVYEHRLRGAWAKAEANADDARRQKERADTNYREARATLVRILQKTKERGVAGIPRLKELEKSQSEEAIAFYLKIAEQTGDDPEIREDSAWAQREAGLLQFEQGQTAQAIDNLRQACDQFTDLSEKFPDNLKYLFGRAASMNALAGIDASIKDLGRFLEDMLALYDKLLTGKPDSVIYRLGLATGCNQLAIQRGTEARYQEAFDLYERAIRLREEALQALPGDRDTRSRIAETYVNLSQLAGQCGKKEKSVECHDRAVAQLTSLIAEDPEDHAARLALATLRINWGYALRESNHAEEAIEELAKNIQDLNGMLKKEPSLFFARDRLYRSHALRAELYGFLKLYEKAIPEFQEAIRFAAADKRNVQQCFLAMAYARAGKHREAIHEMPVLAQGMEAKTQLDYRIYLASVYGVAATAARNDLSLTEPAKAACVATYLKLGLEQLREARKAVPFAEWKMQEPELRSNPDLTPLRADPQWPQLFMP